MKDQSGPDQELILGLITPKRFVQAMAMLPAVTLAATKLPGDLAWLALSFGTAGVVLTGIVVVRAAVGGRRLNILFWVLLAAQVGALMFVIMRSEMSLAWP